MIVNELNDDSLSMYVCQTLESNYLLKYSKVTLKCSGQL
jgi:hypothetical protein